jgi:hypothetical protein
MASWHAVFHLVPRRALATGGALTRATLASRPWWTDAVLPADVRTRLADIARGPVTQEPDGERWGPADGNQIILGMAEGRPASIRALVDVRRLDARFAAALLAFANSSSAVLVRDDGYVTPATAGGFGLAIRATPAWQSVQGPLSAIDPANVGRPDDE